MVQSIKYMTNVEKNDTFMERHTKRLVIFKKQIKRLNKPNLVVLNYISDKDNKDFTLTDSMFYTLFHTTNKILKRI